MRHRTPRPTIRCAMRKHNGSHSILEIARVLSLIAGFTLAGYVGAMTAGAKIVLAKGGGGSGGDGGQRGAGSGSGGSGTGRGSGTRPRAGARDWGRVKRQRRGAAGAA